MPPCPASIQRLCRRQRHLRRLPARPRTRWTTRTETGSARATFRQVLSPVKAISPLGAHTQDTATWSAASTSMTEARERESATGFWQAASPAKEISRSGRHTQRTVTSPAATVALQGRRPRPQAARTMTAQLRRSSTSQGLRASMYFKARRAQHWRLPGTLRHAALHARLHRHRRRRLPARICLPVLIASRTLPRWTSPARQPFAPAASTRASAT